MGFDVARDWCVLGLGRTGETTARYLLEHPELARSVTVYGGLRSHEGDATRALEAAGARVVLGTERVEGHYDYTVASPGISVLSGFFQAAEAVSDEMIGDVELAWRVSPERWVGITGTNGKTTTTTLVAHLLTTAGQPAQTVGNIGTAALSRVDDRAEGEWFVAELSSFQLQTSAQLHPQTACLLNITPDHIEWHGSLEAYAAAKERIFQQFGPDDLAVASEEDDFCLGICECLEARGVRVCRLSVHGEPAGSDAAYVDGDALVVRLKGEERLRFPVEELPIKGEHNAQNALAASAMVLELGVSAADVARGLSDFSPLEHRIEPCGEIAGVRFVNDSKATNTDSVEKALTAFALGSIVLLLGGHDKGTDLTSLATAVARSCHAVVCFGEAGPRMEEAVRAACGSDVTVVAAPHLEEALDAGISLARPDDVVLLSPACSSFDEFTSFEQRGRVFKDLVAIRMREAGER